MGETVCIKTRQTKECGECPCKGCQDRTETCHAKCKAFAEWDQLHKRKREEYRQKVYVERQADYARRKAIRNYYKMVSRIKGKKN